MGVCGVVFIMRLRQERFVSFVFWLSWGFGFVSGGNKLIGKGGVDFC